MDNDLVCVTVVQNEVEAEIAVSALEADGIKAMWQTTNIAAAIRGINLDGGGPIEVLVTPKDAERAKELLGTQA